MTLRHTQTISYENKNKFSSFCFTSLLPCTTESDSMSTVNQLTAAATEDEKSQSQSQIY